MARNAVSELSRNIDFFTEGYYCPAVQNSWTEHMAESHEPANPCTLDMQPDHCDQDVTAITPTNFLALAL